MKRLFSQVLLITLFQFSIFSNTSEEITLNKETKKLESFSQESDGGIPILLLLALPASGKSELRRYLSTLSPQERKERYGINKNLVQIDDFPYVFMMRRISEELEKMGKNGAFFLSAALPFKDPFDWATLMELVNEDYRDFVNREKLQPESAALWLFDRLDQARSKAGVIPAIGQLSEKVVDKLAKILEKEAQDFLNKKNAQIPDSFKDVTLFIEFSRGGADSSSFPLPAPYGYKFALSKLNHGILKNATILYINVTPAEARKKNEERVDPNDPGSILHHGVPRAVMYCDYGCDDMNYLLKTSEIKHGVCIQKKDAKYCLPVAYFDNQKDYTSFIRKEPKSWSKEENNLLQKQLMEAFAKAKKKNF